MLRDRGSLYREDDDGGIENVYRLHIMNTDETTHRYALSVGGVGGRGFTVTMNVPEACSPPVSSAVQMTVVAPTGKVEPLAGAQVGVTGPSSASVAVAM